MDLPQSHSPASGPVPLTKASQRVSLALQIIFAILPILAVSLRIVARRKRQLQLQWDDYLMIIAAIFSLALTACAMFMLLYCGVGFHVQEIVEIYGTHRVTVLLKSLLPMQILWAVSLSATKISLLMFYVRVFNTKAMQIATKIIITLILMWLTASILLAFLLCRPFAYNWDGSVSHGHCGNRMLSYILPGVLNIATDVLVLGLPIPVIWTLQMRRGNKMALSSIFAVGLIVCVVCVLRLISLVTIDYTDATYSLTLPLLWSILEPSATIMLACLPIIKFIIVAPFRSLASRSAGATYGTKGSSKLRSGRSSKNMTGASGTDGGGTRASRYGAYPGSLPTMTGKSGVESVVTEEITIGGGGSEVEVVEKDVERQGRAVGKVDEEGFHAH